MRPGVTFRVLRLEHEVLQRKIFRTSCACLWTRELCYSVVYPWTLEKRIKFDNQNFLRADLKVQTQTKRTPVEAFEEC